MKPEYNLSEDTMCKNETPQRVVRFFGNVNYALESISLKQITLIHIDKLNDPFDPVQVFFTDFNASYDSLLKYVHQFHYQHLPYFKEKLPEQNWKKVVTKWLDIDRRLQENLFVFSTCAVRQDSHPRDNLYMWGHYGNGHRGVAIEFDSMSLTKLIKQDALNGESPWWEMKYTKDVPNIKCEDIVEGLLKAEKDPNGISSYFAKFLSVIGERLRSKAEIWKDENEWRLVKENDETKLKIIRNDIPDEAVAAVYLGCRAAEKEQLRRDFLYETQRHFPNANLFLARMRPGAYALDFEKVNYDL
jgi:hypothetical protein